MAGPWERYQSQESGPWSKYQTAEPEAVTPGPSYGRQIASGIFEGMTGALGAPVDIANAGIGLGMQGINALFGTDFQPSQEPLGGSAGLRRGLAIEPASDQTGHQVARRVSQSVGAAAVPVLGAGGTAGQMAAGLGTAAGGGFGAAVANQVAPDSVGAEILGEVLGSVGTGSAIQGIANILTRRSAEKAVPTIEALKDEASDLYARAEARGVVAGPQQTTTLADDISKIARDNELITPTGRVSEQYPKAREALNLMRDYSGHNMNPTQMQVIRETLSDAAFTTEGNEGRIAKKMLSAFDDFTAPLAPELKQARAVSQRYIQAQNLEKLRRVAEAGAGTYTGSGFENSLRNEYRKLDKAIAGGRAHGWSPEMESAIADVSRGTKAQNAARYVGKFAPTGVVSATGTAGIGAMAGNVVGSPVIGGALGVGGMGAGMLGRTAATRMGLRNAEIAELLARSGGTMQSTTNQGVRDAIARALLGESAMLATQGGR